MRRRGFTLIELLVVLAIIATLLTLTLPRYFVSVDRSKETVLKENLYVTRDAIGKYYAETIEISDNTVPLTPKQRTCSSSPSACGRRQPRGESAVGAGEHHRQPVYSAL